MISGRAILYNSGRIRLDSNKYKLGLDSVAILETNVIKETGTGTALTVFTFITAAITVYCIMNPKACFGSCPTFYVSDGDSSHLMAEGFSSSISPSLEATDIDALNNAKASDGILSVEMRNEALETHVVRHADLLVLPRSESEYCAYDDQKKKFMLTTIPVPPVSAIASEGDCLPLLLKADRKERFSTADSFYLGSKEEIILDFKTGNFESTYGLLISSRQTLLQTYLIYQTMAYMGSNAGYWLAELERRNLSRYQEIEDLIGGIEVLKYTPEKQWETAGVIKEHGPLASDMHLISLGTLAFPESKIKLRMTKGAWRIDYAALTGIKKEVTPLRLHPYVVLNEGKEDRAALLNLLDSTRVLVTLPGDRYTIKYKIPEGYSEFNFFLESRGYYLEWIRKEWIEEENPALLAEIFLAPEKGLRRIAPEFKRVEAQMEDCFWRSKYEKP